MPDTKNIVFQPLQDYVLVDRTTDSETTPGGLFLPEAVRGHDDLLFGRVAAVGPGRVAASGDRVIPSVDVGHTIAYPKHSTRNPHKGPLTEINGVKYDLIRENDVIALIFDEKEATSDDFDPFAHMRARRLLND